MTITPTTPRNPASPHATTPEATAPAGSALLL
ncbi:MAG: hypothetical protein RLZZ344_1816, partial [Pseudomonadota bacterium]